jgi:hypothetical protein
LQATHVPVGTSQTGVAPEHWALVTHWTQMSSVGLQAPVGATQAPGLVAEHGAQLPAGRQAGSAAVVQAWLAPLPKSPLHGTHVPNWQNGLVSAVHCASVTHSTHVFVVVSHCGVAPPQSVKSRHCTHAFAMTLQRGVGELQFASDAQPGPHVCVARLQRPLAPTQSLFDSHCTQVCVGLSQTGSPGVQAVTFFPEASSLHVTHDPAAHAGAVADGQARTAGGTPAVPLSALQGPHVLVAVLQTGFGPVATQLPLVTHWTQVFVPRLQTGVPPMHWLELPALHWTH